MLVALSEFRLSGVGFPDEFPSRLFDIVGRVQTQEFRLSVGVINRRHPNAPYGCHPQ